MLIAFLNFFLRHFLLFFYVICPYSSMLSRAFEMRWRHIASTP